MKEKWYDKGYKQVASILGTDPDVGLTKKQVAKRRAKNGENDVFLLSSTSFRANLIHIVTDYPSILLLFTVLISVIFEKTVSLLAAVSVMLVFYAVMIYTYEKSQRVLEGMEHYALPTAKVMRGGRLYLIKQRRLVQGDVIYLTAGDIVPCDARLIESEDLEALETALTGNPNPVKKNADFEISGDVAPAGQRNMVFASTTLTSGRGKAIACGIGSETLVRKMRKSKPIITHDRLVILSKLKSFSRLFSLISCFLILIVTLLDLFLRKGNTGIVDSFLLALSLSVSSLSEFLPIFGIILIACGVYGAVRTKGKINSGALIKNADKLKIMKDLTCLVVPKEGSFTTADQHIEKVYANGDTVSNGEHGFRREAGKTLKYALMSTGLYVSEQLRKKHDSDGDPYTPEENAILRLTEELGIFSAELENKYPLLDHRGTDADNPFDTTLFNAYGNSMVALRGQAGKLIERCVSYSENGKIREMTAAKASEFRIAAELLEKQTYRVVAVATRSVPFVNLTKLVSCQHELNFEGLIAIREPSTAGIGKTIARCRDAGIRVILLTDDVGDYNVRFAESVGVLKDGDRILTGAEMAYMKEGLYRSELPDYALCQGLSVPQKQKLVRDLKRTGEKVGVLCRRLEEKPVLEEADVCFAQSVTLSDRAGAAGYELIGRNTPVYSKKGSGIGCEALRFVSDVIVSEADETGGGFRSVTDAVSSAGMIYRNLTRMFRHLIITHSFRILAVFAGILLGIRLLTPVQLLVSGMITDLFAVVSMAFTRPDTKMLYDRSDKRNDLDRIGYTILRSLLPTLFWAAAAGITTLIGAESGILPDAGTICASFFIGMLITQQILRIVGSSSRPVLRHGTTVSTISGLTDLMLIVFLLCSSLIPRFGALFGIVPLTLSGWGLTMIPAAAVFLFIEIGKTVRKKSGKAE